MVGEVEKNGGGAEDPIDKIYLWGQLRDICTYTHTVHMFQCIYLNYKLLSQESDAIDQNTGIYYIRI
jgi:hypothetical protein